MENLVKRYFWVINLVVLAVLAYLSARVINNVLAGEIVSVGTTPAPAPVAPLPVRVGDSTATRAWARATIERNLFNPNPPEEVPVEVEPDDGGVDEPVAQGEPPGPDDECKESSARLALLATMVAQPSDWSMAVVDDGEADTARIVKEGQQVGEASVARIYRQRLVLSGASGYECVDLGAKAPRRVSRRSSYRPAYGASKRGSSSEDLSKFITKVGKDSYEIDRPALMEKLDDLNEVTRWARVIPHYRDGQPQGFKIVGVRPGSPLAHLGVRSGDVLKSVNDEEIDSPNKALELLERLKTEDSVVIEMDRRGRKVTLEYRIK